MGNTLAVCRCLTNNTNTSSNQSNSQLKLPSANRQRKIFNPFFQPNSQTEGQINLQEKYRFISNYEDRFMGRCTVLQEIETGNLALNKEIEFKTDAKCRQLVQKLKRKKQQQEQEESILHIIEVFGKRVDGLVKDVSKATIIMEYPLLSIKREFTNRLLNKVDFQIDQIQNLIYSTIKGYATLEKNGSLNEKVRMAHIFMGLRLRQSLIKVIDPQLLQKPSNFKLMSNKGYQDPQNHDIYLAPQQFKALVELKDQPPAQDRIKAAVFSLGATILDLCIMSPSFEVYHYNQKYLNQGSFKGLINIARKRHGTMIYKLLNQMLEWDPKKRPTFQQLVVIMDRHLSQSQNFRSSMRLSTVKDDNSKYMQQTRHSGTYGKLSQTSMRSQSMGDRKFCKGGQIIQEEQIEEIIHMHQQYIGGSQYIGQKKSDMKHGKGKYIFKDRSYYEGWWKEDLMHGEGQLFFSNGKLQYQGEWAYGQPNGWGVLFADSQANPPKVWTRYQGEMRNGEMHGRGKIYFVDNTIFEGEFQNGKIFGRGCRVSPNGEMIEKEWRLMSLEMLFNHDDSNSKIQHRLSGTDRNL